MNIKTVKDHLGKQYASITAMCGEYGIDRSTYSNRIGAGWSIEKILTTPKRPQRGRK